MNTLDTKEIATEISQSLFYEKFPDVDNNEKKAVNRAIWYIYNTTFGRQKILKKSSSTFKVPMNRVDSYIRDVLGNDIFLKRNKIIDRNFMKKLEKR